MPNADSRQNDRASGAQAHATGVIRAITAGVRAADVLAMISHEARDMVGADLVAIGLREGTDGILSFAAVAGGEASEIVGLHIRGESSLAVSALRTGEPAVMSYFDGDIAAPGAVRRAAVAVPFGVGKPTSGVLIALRFESEFTQSDVDDLAGATDLIELAVRADEAAAARTKRERELALLHRCVTMVGRDQDVQVVLDSVLATLGTGIPHRSAALFLLNDESTHLFIAADINLDAETRDVQLAADAGFAAGLPASGEPLIVGDLADHPELHTLSQSGTNRSALLAPIVGNEGPIGLLAVLSSDPAAYDNHDAGLLSAVATTAAAAISSARLYEEVSRRAEETTTLYNLSQHIASMLQVDPILERVATSAGSLLESDMLVVFLYDRREQRLVPRIGVGLDEGRLARYRPRIGEGIPGWVYEWMTPAAISDMAADSRERLAPMDLPDITSCLCVPLGTGEEMLGVVLAASSRRREYRVAEMELLYTIANQTATAIHNASRYEVALGQWKALRRYMVRVATALGAARGTVDLPQLIADLAVDVLSVDRCVVYGSDGVALQVAAAAGFRTAATPELPVAIGDGLTGAVARRGAALVLDDVTQDARAEAHPWMARERIRSYMGIPIKVARRTVGVVEVATQEPRHFAERAATLLSQFARHADLGSHLAVTEHD